MDWEPCVLRFIFSPRSFASSRLRSFVETWLKERRNPETCGCKYRYAEFTSEDGKGAETLRTEWLCEVCAQALVQAVQLEFPSLQKVELGLRQDSVITGEFEFIEVPAKEVQLEDGGRTSVPSFSIAKRPVTVGDFENFVRATGYLTLAEQYRNSQTFRSHCGLSGLASSVRLGVPVQFVTIVDAEAFCRHVACRLPTEAEWLAAAVLEAGELELTPWEELQRRSRPLPRNALEVNNWEITSTRFLVDHVVTRRGPLHFLKKGWREQPLLNFNRRIIGDNDFDISITFRLARDG